MKAMICEMCSGTNFVKQAGIYKCQNCGLEYSSEEAKKLYLEIVAVKGVSTVENDLIRGDQSLDAQDWKGAYRYFCAAIDKDAMRPDAWFGCFRAMTQGLSSIEQDWIRLEGNRGFTSVVRNCVTYSQEKHRDDIINSIRAFLDMINHKKSMLWKEIEEIEPIAQEREIGRRISTFFKSIQ